MKVLFFANRMPDLCGAFLHDIDLATELQTRGHQVVFLTIRIPKEGYNGGTYRGFRFVHYTAATPFLESSEVWICPHSPILPDVRKLNSRGYNRPIIATCHFDGNYTAIRGNSGTSWNELLLFINGIMEVNYRRNIVPWPSQIKETAVIRPILHSKNIIIPERFAGQSITLVNANQNKGVAQFLELARKMPTRRFLGVLPYYGELRVPPSPGNVEWVPFTDDIRTVLRRTRILLVPSYYESFGRIAVEAMINRIPVLYSAPTKTSIYPGGSTEGLHEWISPVGIPCDREQTDTWIAAIQSLDDEDVYQHTAEESKNHVDAMNVFEEANRIATRVEDFARQNPVVIRMTQAPSSPRETMVVPGRVREPPPNSLRPGGFGFLNGRLKIQR